MHTFRFINAQGQSTFVKFHWNPLLGTHSLVWDEAVKISGADSDFNRRDLWEAIEAGVFPEYELGIQIFSEEEAERFTFDVLDSTKIIPEELVPVKPIGKMVLNRNPDNFFAETEQVAFCAGNIYRALTSPMIHCWPAASFRILTLSSYGWAAPIFMKYPLTRRSPRLTTTSGMAFTGRR